MKQDKTKRYYFFWLPGLAVVLLAGWWFLHQQVGGTGIRHVVLISIDTCRADHLSCYGFNKQTTPNIDKIAQQGVLFENAVSPAPITLPAHISLLTGTIPPFHGIHDNLNYFLEEEKLTLAEILNENGFRTGGVISAFVLDARFGLAQGFEFFQDDFVTVYNSAFGSERRGDESTRFALDWLEKHKDEKTFLFLHYYDPHSLYDPPEPYATEFARDPYSGEIAFTDFCIGRMVAKLKELGMYDSTLLIVVGDHGEMLGEHGEAEHLYFIYESALKVPLIIKLPGSREPVRVRQSVGLIDVVPTVCGLLDIDIPSPVQGVNLEPFIRGKQPAGKSRYFYIESMMPTYLGANPLLGVRTDRWKYISTTRPELYDLESDPEERVNLVKTQAKQARMCQGALEKIVKQQRTRSKGSRRLPDRETINKLASLGYMGANVSKDAFSIDRDKPDAKDSIDLHVALQQVQALKFKGELAEAKRILEEQVNRPPHFKVYEQLGEIYLRENNVRQAIVNFSRSLELNRNNYLVNVNMGAIMAKQGKPAQAISYFQKALEISPNDIKAQRNLGIVLENTGKIKEACECFQNVLAQNPGDIIALNHLGTSMLAQGNRQAAIKYLLQSLKVNQEQPVVLARLAQIKILDHSSSFYDPAGALPLALEACRLTSFNNPRLLYVLVLTYIHAGKVPEAVKTTEQALRLARAAGDRQLERQLLNQLNWLKKQ
jgi:arylsulfatase A-like enzyme/tetratricopeptide (TPR) repeat protein